MKAILSTAFIIGCLFAATAQNSLRIPELLKPKTVSTLPINSAQLTSVSIPAPRGGGSNNQDVWIIQRDMDQYSSAIQNASDKGRAFRKVIVKIGSGDQMLRQALISNYSITASGNSNTESFYIQFSN